MKKEIGVMLKDCEKLANRLGRSLTYKETYAIQMLICDNTPFQFIPCYLKTDQGIMVTLNVV